MAIFVSGSYIIYWCAYLVGYYIKHANGTARYCISHSFDLPPATTPVSHLTCPLPLHHCTTMSPRYCITTSLYYCITTLPHHCVTASPHYHITMSPCEIFPHHIGMNHLTCPTNMLPCHHMRFSSPHWFESFDLPLPLHYSATASLCYCITMSPHHCITTSPSHWVTVLPRHHLTMLLHYHITVLPHYCITMLVSHLTHNLSAKR